jgi:hypothetical protein
MRKTDTKASMAVLMVGLLVVGGAGTFFVAVNPFDIAAISPMDATQHYNMTIKVGVIVEGRQIPIIGADVSVWSCNVNMTNDSVVITFTRVAHTVTERGGNVTFNLPAGQYIMVANYSGLQSIQLISLVGDVSIDAILHNPQKNVDVGMWACVKQAQNNVDDGTWTCVNQHHRHNHDWNNKNDNHDGN